MAAPNPTCSALAAAIERKKISYDQIAAQLNTPKDDIVAICTGTRRPTDAEFDALARVLDIKERPPHEGVHSTA